MIKFKFFAGVILISLMACEKDNSHKSVLGSWNCQEFPDHTQGRIYTVNIQRNTSEPNSTNQYDIYNFFNAGSDDDMVVHFVQVNDTLLNIPIQTNSRITINGGVGIISNNYEKIVWEYKVTSATGQETYRATYY